MGKLDPKKINPRDPNLRQLDPYHGVDAVAAAERIVAEAARQRNGGERS